ncbi:MAG: nuclear transport factor 2 family protein [Daejeonella sp.]|uniref:nuclear transport factor 2 family protein n=1 Tax=Daejeonella sp. TaxID=2805397 RepID=UPI002734C824|nr:nuclear transport factor 2 family protein [Daejeonella sp.]MDP3469756.1 nuclear transport factor 2 family protein [Daejeonella sp.]
MNLKSIMFYTVLCAVLTTSSFAKNRPAPNVKNVINEYAESHVNTDAAKLGRILSSDAVLKFSKGDEVLSQSQISIMKIMKQNEGIKQNCSTTIDVIASGSALAMAKVNFIYEDFVIENFLTLELDRNGKWKITRINKFFTPTEPGDVLTRR